MVQQRRRRPCPRSSTPASQWPARGEEEEEEEKKTNNKQTIEFFGQVGDFPFRNRDLNKNQKNKSADLFLMRCAMPSMWSPFFYTRTRNCPRFSTPRPAMLGRACESFSLLSSLLLHLLLSSSIFYLLSLLIFSRLLLSSIFYLLSSSFLFFLCVCVCPCRRRLLFHTEPGSLRP
jgi:hypothetical protein